MKIGIVADVHSNLAALTAVLEDAGGVDAWWSLGDVVGYGPQPVQCLDLLDELGCASVAGNHDLASAGLLGLERFNAAARTSNEWTRRMLSEERARSLGGGPEKLAALDGSVLLVHGSPRDPVWEYVNSEGAASRNFAAFDERICFNGHSHVPAVFRRLASGGRVVERVEAGESGEVPLADGSRFMVNAGSVGQPRDGDPRSCYLLFEPDRSLVRIRRVEYDIAATQRLIEAAGLDARLAARLALGR